MKERPILFSGPMVRAILEGRKTQTRRIMKPQPTDAFLPEVGEYQRTLVDRKDGEQFPDPVVRFGASDEAEDYPCPYGQPGDRLWVRETWAPRGVNPVYRPDGKFGAAVIEYRADGTRATWNHDPIQRIKDDWRPSIFLPRWASRITLEVTAVRVERLQDISENDAKAEGVENANSFVGIGADDDAANRYAYRELWESINGAGSWAENPWVWVIEFRRVTP